MRKKKIKGRNPTSTRAAARRGQVMFVCYACGDPIGDGDEFVVGSPTRDTDRAFLAHTNCAEVLEYDAQVTVRLSARKKSTNVHRKKPKTRRG